MCVCVCVCPCPFLSHLQGLVGRLGAGFTELNTDFGELCDGVVGTVLDEYEQAVEGVNGGSGVLSRKKAELKRTMLRELGARCVYLFVRVLVRILIDL